IRMRDRTGLSQFLVLLSSMSLLTSTAWADNRNYRCSKEGEQSSEYRLLRHAPPSKGVSWGREYKPGTTVSCGYVVGNPIALTARNLWADYASVNGKKVWVYRGIAVHGSQGQVRIFSERSASVRIVDIHKLTSTRFLCGQ